LPEGVDWDTSKSLGLPIVDVLTQQLRGTLTVSSPLGRVVYHRIPKGSHFARD
jgi:hypothetical protein